MILHLSYPIIKSFLLSKVLIFFISDCLLKIFKFQKFFMCLPTYHIGIEIESTLCN